MRGGRGDCELHDDAGNDVGRYQYFRGGGVRRLWCEQAESECGAEADPQFRVSGGCTDGWFGVNVDSDDFPGGEPSDECVGCGVRPNGACRPAITVPSAIVPFTAANAPVLITHALLVVAAGNRGRFTRLVVMVIVSS